MAREKEKVNRPMWLRVLMNLPLLIVVVWLVAPLIWGESSYVNRRAYKERIDELETKIKEYEDSAKYYNYKATQLTTDREEVERVARSQFGMKAEDEEVYITDIK